MNSNQPASAKTPEAAGIRWTEVLSLLLLDLAILLSWMAYNEYQPRLVEKFGYASETLSFLIVQTAILIITPPVAGQVTDRLLARGGARLAVVNLGVSLAAMVFMATALAVSGQPNPLLAMVFPLLIVLWLISMNIFHSPAISMLELYAPPSLLTGVSALFTLLANLTAALEPSLTVFIDVRGASPTFAAGGVIVALAGFWFLRSSKNTEARGEQQRLAIANPERSAFGWILLVGVSLGLGEALIGDLLPGWIAQHGDLAADFSPAVQSSFLYALTALVAWPLGLVGNRYHSDRLALAGAVSGLALGLGAWLLPPDLARVALWGFPVAYSALAVAALPVSFAWLRPEHKVFGVGLLFSGIELAGGLVKIALSV